MAPRPTRPARARAPLQRGGERGAILMVALALCVTLGLMSIAVLATRDAVVRSLANGTSMRLAEAAAAAGVEWAAARDVQSGRITGTTTLVLGDGSTAVVRVATTSPHVVSEGRHAGTRVTLRADLAAIDGAPLPYAFASFAGTNTIDQDLTIQGSAYFGANSSPLSGGADLLMYGDLKLVASGNPPSGMVQHFSGTTVRNVGAHALPVVDTAPFASMAASASVRRFSGNTRLQNWSHAGVVVVELGSGHVLTIEDTVITGTVVVVAEAGLLGGGGLLGLGLIRPKVRLAGTVTIGGGTATTGNLALLADFCTLDGDAGAATVDGTVLVHDAENVRNLTVNGQLVLMRNLRDADSPWRVERRAGFVPDTPLGVRWPCRSSTAITWLGRQ